MLLQLTENLEVEIETSFSFPDFPALVCGCHIEKTMLPNHSEGIKIHIQSIFIIRRFHICQFAYLLKFICNPQINTVLLMSFLDTM